MMLTLDEIAARADPPVPDTSIMRRDIKAGLLTPLGKFGPAWAIDEAEAERWIRDVWPKHVAARKKPVGSKKKMLKGNRK